MVGMFIAIFLYILQLFTFAVFNLGKIIVKIASYFIDFIIVGFWTYITLEKIIGKDYSILFSIISVIIYGIILIIISKKFETLSKVIHYVISFIGSVVAWTLTLDFFTSYLTSILVLKDSYTMLPITGNIVVNKIIHYMIAFFISLIVYSNRISFFNNIDFFDNIIDY